MPSAAKNSASTLYDSYSDPLRVANKVQGHELKGLRQFYSHFFARRRAGLVSFPLISIIDYCGYRITAMTQLPIDGSKTLIYGSRNAGGACTVENKVPAWTNFVSEACSALNLAPHFVHNDRGKGEIELNSCVDLEGHAGTDGRMYLLDFSRLFPADLGPNVSQKDNDPLQIYYRLFRPEFLQSWSTPLSADTYSNFQSRANEAKSAAIDAKAASKHLQSSIVQVVCKDLSLNQNSITRAFHSHGLPMRYLGLVYAQMVTNELFSAQHSVIESLIAESLARTFKVRTIEPFPCFVSHPLH